MAPVAVAAAPCVMLSPTAVREVRGVVPPTAPEKLTAPPVPAFRLNVLALLIAAEKLMFAPAAVAPLFVASNVRFAPKATGPISPIAPPFVVTLPLILRSVPL